MCDDAGLCLLLPSGALSATTRGTNIFPLGCGSERSKSQGPAPAHVTEHMQCTTFSWAQSEFSPLRLSDGVGGWGGMGVATGHLFWPQRGSHLQ